MLVGAGAGQQRLRYDDMYGGENRDPPVAS